MTGSLMSRAADVVLKERRRLALGVRETPLVPAFYSRPLSAEDIVDHAVGRLLDLFEIETHIVKRWKDGEGNTGSDSVLRCRSGAPADR